MLENPNAQEPSNRWTYEADSFLRKHAKESSASLARKMGRSPQAIVARKSRLGLRQLKPWTAEDHAFILANTHLTIDAMAAQLGRSYSSLAKQIISLGIKVTRKQREPTGAPTVRQINREMESTKSGRWSPEEEELLLKQSRKSTPDWLGLARTVGRSYNAVLNKAFQMGALKNRRKQTTEEEYEQVRRLASKGKTIVQIAAALDRSPRTMFSIVRRLGIDTRHGNQTVVDEEKLVRMLKTKTMRAVIKKFRISQPRVRQIAKQHGITLHPPGRRKAA